MNISGAYTALVTPFDASGAIDFDALDRLVERQAAGGVTGVVPCGTTGETPALSIDEHLDVVAHVVGAVQPHGLQVIAGAGSNSTAHAVELHRAMAERGADATLQVVPYYNKPSQRGLEGHFTAIADSCDLPVVLYDVPGRTCRGLDVDTIATLAEHPNIVAIKDATGDLDHASGIAQRTSLALLSGDDTLTLPIASVGGVGVVSVAGNVVPDRVAELCRAFIGGGWSTARAMHFALFDLARGLLALDVNPVPVKAALAQLGVCEAYVRQPLAPIDTAGETRVAELLLAAGLAAQAVA